MTETTTTSKPKNKGGRPRKKIKGQNMWVPADYVAIVKAMISAGKQLK